MALFELFRRLSRLFFIASLTFCCVFIWKLNIAEGEKTLLVAFLDVGQGDSIFIEAPNGNQMLIDGGSNGKILERLNEEMGFSDRTIDVVLATHPDKDHIGGLVDVLERYEVGTFVENGAKNDTAVYRRLESRVREIAVDREIARRGMVFDLGDGVRFFTLYPFGDVSGFKETNDGSIVGILQYGNTRFVLTGDASKKVEYQILSKDEDILKSDVLKAGHHGSRTSSSPEFIKSISPEYVVISAGENNSYGHPHKEVVSTFEEANVKIKRTDQAGTVRFISDGETLVSVK